MRRLRWRAAPAGPGPVSSADPMVRSTQSELIRLGYQQAAPHGHMGPRTRGAISSRAGQRSAGGRQPVSQAAGQAAIDTDRRGGLDRLGAEQLCRAGRVSERCTCGEPGRGTLRLGRAGWVGERNTGGKPDRGGLPVGWRQARRLNPEGRAPGGRPDADDAWNELAGAPASVRLRRLEFGRGCGQSARRAWTWTSRRARRRQQPTSRANWTWMSARRRRSPRPPAASPPNPNAVVGRQRSGWHRPGEPDGGAGSRRCRPSRPR